MYIYIYIPLFVTLKKVYDRNVVNKYGLYLLLGVIIYNLIDYIYIYISIAIHHRGSGSVRFFQGSWQCHLQVRLTGYTSTLWQSCKLLDWRKGGNLLERDSVHEACHSLYRPAFTHVAVHTP